MGTRVVLLRAPQGSSTNGVITEIRIAPHLKRFVIQRDDGEICYASESDLALESDASLAPLGQRVHEE